MIGVHEQVHVHTHWMTRRDMPDVLATESSLPSPWTEDDFLCRLRQPNVVGHVAEREDRVIAHMLYRLSDESINLLRFAVHPVCRRLGVGSQMLAKLKAKLKSKLSPYRRTTITMQVPERALDLQLFLRDAGFKCEKSLGDEYGFAFRRTP